jgi:hypothetical protein
MVETRKLFWRGSAPEGLSTQDFLTPRAHALDAQLGDLVGMVHDRKLRRRIDAVFKTYREAWALALPDEEGSVLGVPETSDHQARRERLDRQADVVCRGLDEVAAALDRLNGLERFLVLRA